MSMTSESKYLPGSIVSEQKIQEFIGGYEDPAHAEAIGRLCQIAQDNPIRFVKILSTGSLLQIAAEADVSCNNGYIRDFFRRCKESLEWSDEEVIANAVAQTLFADSKNITAANFKFRRLQGGTYRIFDTDELERTCGNPVFNEAFTRYQQMESLRNEVAPELEQRGFFVNSVDNAFGLIVRVSKDGTKMKIADFIRSIDNMSAIYLIDRETTSEEDISLLYSDYAMPYKEYYVWSGFELKRFCSLLIETPDTMNWKVYDGIYRGIGNMVWDTFNAPGFFDYAATHSSSDTARKFNITTRQLGYLRRKYPDLHIGEASTSVADVASKVKQRPLGNAELLRKFVKCDEKHLCLLTKDNDRYPEARRRVSLGDNAWNEYGEKLHEMDGYVRNDFDEGLIVINIAGAPDGYLVPDAVSFRSSRGAGFATLTIGVLERDTAECIQALSDIKIPDSRVSYNVIWPDDIQSEYEGYTSKGRLQRSFGRCYYKGQGSVYGLDKEELRIFALTHSNEEIVEHYQLAQSKNAVQSYLAQNHLRRKDTLATKAFPSPYQTIPRERLPEKWDTIRDLGRYYAGRTFRQIWHDIDDGELEAFKREVTPWCSYWENASHRQEILVEFEKLGFFENRIDNAYGLIYRVLSNGSFVVPDLILLTDGMPEEIYVIDGNLPDDMLALFERQKKDNLLRGMFVIGYIADQLDNLSSIMRERKPSRRNLVDATSSCMVYALLSKRYRKRLNQEALEQIEKDNQRKQELETLLDIRPAKAPAPASSNDSCPASTDLVEKIVVEEKPVLEEAAPVSISNNYTVSLPELSELESPLVWLDQHDVNSIPSMSGNTLLRQQVAAAMEMLGYRENQVENRFVCVEDESILVPDYIGVAPNGLLDLVCLVDRETFTKRDYDWLMDNRRSLFIAGAKVQLLWSGRHMEQFNIAVCNGQFRGWTGIFRASFLGKGELCWDMVNDEEFASFYQQSSIKQVCKRYKVTAEDLEYMLEQCPGAFEQ